MKRTVLFSVLVALTAVACEAPESKETPATKTESHTDSVVGSAIPNEDKAQMDFINSFYTSYISWQTDLNNTQLDIEELKKQTCTPELLKSLEQQELEADPFLNAQDVDFSWLSSLAVEKKGTNQFVVSYRTGYNDQVIRIGVGLVKDGSSYKIASAEPG
jgi:hypothetical protein